MVGRTVSHYQITERLGQGGMGVVYKAQDIRLDRAVALKFLPAHSLLTDDDRARFFREARAAARLNHAHIAHVYEIDETDDGRAFIAMEYVEGETLASAIKQGPLKLQEAITISTQIAEGLQAAHEAGIVHRDVKSSNVMLTAKGQVKIMDFGLARMAGATMLTKEGTAVGTVAYMSPEQARGEEVDHRSDIWSLGVVLYEMLSGLLPFAGDYEQAVIYAIMNAEPEPLTGLRTGVSMALERVVTKCLMKDPAGRYQHVDEVAVDLKAVDVGKSGSLPTAQTTTTIAAETPRARRWVPWVGGLLLGLVGGLLAASMVFQERGAAPEAPVRFTLPVPDGYETSIDGGPALAVSPDGRTIVYRENGSLVRRSLDQEHAEPIPGTEGAETPVFSPDGNGIVFLQDDRLKRLSAEGVITSLGITPIDWIHGADWGVDDAIVYSRMAHGIWRLDARSGEAEQITEPADFPEERGHAWPQLVKRGSALLFTTVGPSGTWHDAKIVLQDLATGRRFVVVRGGAHGRYVPTGHVLYATEDGVLQALPYDLDTHEAGTPFPVESGLLLGTWGAGVSFAVSPSGTLVFVRGNNLGLHLLYWFDRDGRRVAQLGQSMTALWGLEIDPNGRHIATALPNNRNHDIYILDPGMVNPRRFTSDPASEGWPVWSPDGSRLAWRRVTSGGFGTVVVKGIDDDAKPTVLYRGRGGVWPRSWSPDGRWLLLSERTERRGMDILAVDVEDSTNVQVILADPSKEWDPQISPDRAFLAFDTDEGGRHHTHVTTFPAAGELTRIPVGRAQHPRWSPNRNELYFWQDTTLMVARYTTQPRFAVQEISSLFSVPDYIVSADPFYDVRPDDQGFLIQVHNPYAAIREIHVVLNWFEELKRLGTTNR